MRLLKLVCICMTAATFAVQAEKNTFSVISVSPSLPIIGSSAPVDTIGGTKKLRTGWSGAWTFFGLPFTNHGPALSGLAFGGKISYSRWVRDSTGTMLYFFGTQGIVRYYVPLNLKPFELFVQGGGGMFIGEHGFADIDTVDREWLPSPIQVMEGIKKIGLSFNIGMDWDVIELSPGITFVPTRGKPSAWFSIDAAMKL